MEEKKIKALEFFELGNNCGQSVAMAFADEMGLSKEQAQVVTKALGSGIGGQGEICGAMAAAAMVIGAREKGSKAEVYKKIREAGDAFRKTFGGHIRCEEILKEDRVARYQSEQSLEGHWGDFLSRRPCAACVAKAVEVLMENK